MAPCHPQPPWPPSPLSPRPLASYQQPPSPLSTRPPASLLPPRPLPSTHVDAAITPLLLSPSFPPIPAKLAAKAQSGAFVALKEFLGDNIALVQRLDEVQGSSSTLTRTQSTACMRDLLSPLQWAFCFITYAAVQSKDPDLRDLLAYGRIVLSLAQHHNGAGWLEYDRVFRQQATADHSILWNTLNPSLMAATVLSTPALSPTSFCPFCHEADHKGPECALASVDLGAGHKISGAPHTSSRPKPYSRPSNTEEICRRFNRGTCFNSPRCRYRHACFDCSRPRHGSNACPFKPEAPRTRFPGPPPTK